MRKKTFGLAQSEDGNAPGLLGHDYAVDLHILYFCLLTATTLSMPSNSFAGTVVAWGDNSFGQTNVPPDLINAVQIDASYYDTIALSEDGSVTVWGLNDYGQTNVPPNLTNVVRVAAGRAHCTALRADGSVISWGITNGIKDWGQSYAPTNINNAVAIAAGQDHNLALLRDGTVKGWGSDDFSQIWNTREVQGVCGIAAGLATSFLLLTNGTVLAFGWDHTGHINPPADLSNVVAVAVHDFNNIALRSDGTVATWGDAVSGPQPIVSNVVAISAGSLAARVLFADNSSASWSWGTNSLSYDLPPNVSNILAIAETGGSGWGEFTVVLTGHAPCAPFSYVKSVAMSNDNIRMTLQSQRGILYVKETTKSLTTPHWSLSPPFPGDGRVVTLEDAINAADSSLFYRIRKQ